jgi:hypothetical protein
MVYYFIAILVEVIDLRRCEETGAVLKGVYRDGVYVIEKVVAKWHIALKSNERRSVKFLPCPLNYTLPRARE